MSTREQRRRDLIPRAVRLEVVDTVGGWGLYTISQIADLFVNEGFERAENPEPGPGGQRKQEAHAFHAAIDFSDPDQAVRYLRVVEKILDDHDEAAWQERRQRLLKALKRADVELDARGRLQLPTNRPWIVPSLALPTESGIRLQLARLERLDQEPEEMIGAAKELIESTAKHVLLELGEDIPKNADLPALSKAALAKLKLHPETIAPTTRGAEVMVRMLAALGQTATALAELRNLGYGTGHGSGRRFPGLQSRHAQFAARAAITYATFVLATLHDPDAPWRSNAVSETSDRRPPADPSETRSESTVRPSDVTLAEGSVRGRPGAATQKEDGEPESALPLQSPEH